MKNLISMLFLTMIIHVGHSQTVQRTSLNSGGISSSASGISITSSFGQPFSAYTETPNIKLFMGFQQKLPKSVASIQPNNNLSLIQVYPNPFVSEIYINTETKINSESLKLTNIAGQEVAIKNIHSYPTQYLLELGNLPTGIYFLYFIDINHQTHSIKLLK